MLSFAEFFVNCIGQWTTERTYHFLPDGKIERSHTEFRADLLLLNEKERIITQSNAAADPLNGVKLDLVQAMQDEKSTPGFAIGFDTVSEHGERVSMSLNALFIPDTFVTQTGTQLPPLPLVAQVALAPDAELVQGFYLRDEGYSEAGAIAGRFTYQATRQTLEMTTYYRQSVAVDQMRLVSPTVRLRTIVTYQRPPANPHPASNILPTEITLIGFGVEQKLA